MIARITGALIEQRTDTVVVGVGGLGLLVATPARTSAGLGPTGAEVTLHTTLHVREDHIALYGFGTPAERTLFEQLLTVNGIGPRLALQILSTLSVQDLYQAVISDRPEALTRVPGVGKKTASRLLLDLKGKIGVPDDLGEGTTFVAPLARGGEAIVALTGLGFSASEAEDALARLPRELGLDDQIRQALRLLAAH